MVTEKEKQLVDEILAEGDAKYFDKIKVFADVIGVDRSLALDRCTWIWKWLKDNRERYKEIFNRHGVGIRETHDDGDTFVMKDNDGFGGYELTEMRIQTYVSGSTRHVIHYMAPGEYKNRHTTITATDAIDAAARAIKEITLWTLLAIRYKAIKREVDGIETDESDERVKKARHQLELLRKL